MKKSIILLHGAWYTSECWKLVKAQLTAQGYRVETPDYPQYKLDKINNREITLADYVDVVRKKVFELKKEGYTKPLIVGHSLSGIVLSEISRKIPHDIGGLVYLSAFRLENGQSIQQFLAKNRVVNPKAGAEKIEKEVRINTGSVIKIVKTWKLIEETIEDKFFNDLLPLSEQIPIRKTELPCESCLTQTLSRKEYTRKSFLLDNIWEFLTTFFSTITPHSTPKLALSASNYSYHYLSSEECDYLLYQKRVISKNVNPLAIVREPIRTTKQIDNIPQFYIKCTEDHAVPPREQDIMCKGIKNENIFTMETSHSPFFSKPEELANIILQIYGKI